MIVIMNPEGAPLSGDLVREDLLGTRCLQGIELAVQVLVLWGSAPAEGGILR